MKPRQRVSKSGLELIKRFEGYRRFAARLPDGRWTVGYGHVKFAKEGVELTEKDAEALLIYDLIETAGAVNDHIFAPLSQNQFDALVSFAFNVGVEKFKSSSVLRRVNEGDFPKAAWALEVWRRAAFEGEPIVVDALVRRRAAEKALFLTPDGGFVPAPSSVLSPEVDYDVEGRPPVGAPATLVMPLDGAIAEAYRAPEAALLTEAAPPATVVATDQVTERLRALVPDEAPSEPAAAPESPPEALVEPAAVEETIAPFPAQEEAAVAEPAPDAAPEPPPAPAAQPDVAEAVEERSVPTPERVGGIRHFQRTASKGKSPLPLIGFSVAGLGLFAFAVFWRLNAGAAQGDNASDQAVSYIAGILGVICIFMAAYLVLDRFAGDED